MKKLAWLLFPLVLGFGGYFAYTAAAHVSDSPAPSATHTSMYYYDNPGFFTDSLKPFASTSPASPHPRIFITNQHILAASLIAHQFALAADPAVTTVVLITQNNWDAGTAPIITSRENWETPLGAIADNLNLTDALIRKGHASVDEGIFVHEHGITGIVPYVAYAFPNAKIVTLVIRDKTPNAVLDALANDLGALDLSRTAIVGTIDMSHYLPKYLSDEHDAKTLQAIGHMDFDTLPKLDIDTAPTLRVVMKVAAAHGENAFTLTGHANSADITAQPDLLSTTSYITGYFAKGKADASVEPVHLLFTGDVMLDRAVAARAKANGDKSLFAQVERLFLGTDEAVVNNEGTITPNASVAAADPRILRFTFDPHLASFMAQLGITAASLSNNHSGDFGPDGYLQTLSALHGAGITPFGSPDNRNNLSVRLAIRGTYVCLVGYEGFINPDPSPIATEIARLRPSCDIIIATMHAGVEYEPGYAPIQQAAAHAFIDAGADAVIGTHPHVVEPLEIYKGKAVFYSLGNFMFDQDFSFATEHGLAVHMEWSPGGIRYVLIPVTVKGETVTFSTPAEGMVTLHALVDNGTPASIANAILSTHSFTAP